MKKQSAPVGEIVELGSGSAPEAQGQPVDEHTQVMAPTAQPGNSWSEMLKQLPPQPVM
jgi:hypothetical protein